MTDTGLEGSGSLIGELGGSTRRLQWGLAVRVSRMEMLKKDRRILFNPAFVMIPELFVPGREIHSTGRATIEAMKTRETVNSGKYRYEIKAPSHTAIDTPAGAREGYLLAYEFQIDLDYSHLRLNLETGWSKNRELVYWRTQTTVEKLGLFSETTLQAMALTNSCENR